MLPLNLSPSGQPVDPESPRWGLQLAMVLPLLRWQDRPFATPGSRLQGRGQLLGIEAPRQQAPSINLYEFKGQHNYRGKKSIHHHRGTHPFSVCRPTPRSQSKKSHGVHHFPGKTREKGIHHRSGKKRIHHGGLRHWKREKGGFPRWWCMFFSSLRLGATGPAAMRGKWHSERRREFWEGLWEGLRPILWP